MLRRIALLLLIGSFAAAAEKPTLDHIYPAAAARGSTNDVTLFGKFEPWPPQFWSNASGLDFQLTTNKGKARVVISADAPPGPCLVRLYNDAGPSDLRIFVITEKPELVETEPNNYFVKAQAITNLPATVNGRLEKNGDVDSFRLEMKGGQWLDAAVDSYTILAKLDPVLRLVTTNGYQLAWNHDFSSLDPRLVWQAPYDLTAVLQVFGFLYPADADIRLSGGASAVYRLHLSLSEDAPADLREIATEHEPNNATTNAVSLQVPGSVIGAICPSGDVDRFKIELRKDDIIEARVQAATLGSQLDPWIAIEDNSGEQLARNDDAENSRDPRLEWKAPKDGVVYLVLGSATHQGSAECRYHLNVKKLGPEYRLTSAADSLVVSDGSTNTLKLNLKRFRGFTNELLATVEHLPEGIRVDDLTLPAKDGEISLPFIVATNAPAFNGAFTVMAIDKSLNQKRPVSFELVSRTENNGVPGGYSKLLVESTDQLWLTVKAVEQKAAASDKK